MPPARVFDDAENQRRQADNLRAFQAFRILEVCRAVNPQRNLTINDIPPIPYTAYYTSTTWTKGGNRVPVFRRLPDHPYWQNLRANFGYSPTLNIRRNIQDETFLNKLAGQRRTNVMRANGTRFVRVLPNFNVQRYKSSRSGVNTYRYRTPEASVRYSRARRIQLNARGYGGNTRLYFNYCRLTQNGDQQDPRTSFVVPLARFKCVLCKTFTQIYPFCTYHAKRSGVEIKDTEDENGDYIGKGLFATRDFRPGDFITVYSGDVLPHEMLNVRYPGQNQATYAIEYTGINQNRDPPGYYSSLDRQRYDVEAASFRSYGAIANHFSDRRNINAEIDAIQPGRNNPLPDILNEDHGFLMAMYATQYIHYGEEILIDYGRQYDPNHENLHATAPQMLLTADDIQDFLDAETILYQLPPNPPPIPVGPQNRPPQPPPPPPIPIGPRNQPPPPPGPPPPPPPGLPPGMLAEIRQTAEV